ncbi:hypothetical protein SRHO_G00187000 [Serrasalmus rhombeus]
MAGVLEQVIHPDQACAIPGRRITDSLIMIRDTVCLVRDRIIRLIVLNLDFDISGRSARQGCPLSPLLYVACIEPLAQCLRRDTWVNGVSIPGSGGKEVKCVVYMDDMNIICTNEESDRERPCLVPGLTEAQVEEVWRNATHPALRNTHKDLSWLAAHEALPARAVMHSRGMAKNPICPQLGCGAAETVRHMLWECNAARDLWLRTSALWCPYLPAGGPQTLVYRQAVNGVGWSRALPPATFRELWPILNSVKDAIWESRNLLVGKRVEVSLQAKVKMVEKAVQEYTRHASRRTALGPQARKVEGATVPGCPQMHPTSSGWSSGAAV